MERLISPLSIDLLVWASGFSVALVGFALGLQLLYQIRIQHRITGRLLKKAGVLAATMTTNLMGVAYVVAANERIHIDLAAIARGVATVISGNGFIASAGLAVATGIGLSAIQHVNGRRQAALRGQRRHGGR